MVFFPVLLNSIPVILLLTVCVDLINFVADSKARKEIYNKANVVVVSHFIPKNQYLLDHGDGIE